MLEEKSTRTETHDEEMERRKAWLEKLEAAIDLSLDEELPDLTRSDIMCEPINLAD